MVSVQSMYGGNKKNIGSLVHLIIWHSQRCLKDISLPTGLGEAKKGGGDELKLSFRTFFQFSGRNKPVKLHYVKSASNISVNPKQNIYYAFFWRRRWWMVWGFCCCRHRCLFVCWLAVLFIIFTCILKNH